LAQDCVSLLLYLPLVSCKHDGPQHAHVLCIDQFSASCGVLCAVAGFIIVSAAMGAASRQWVLRFLQA
jgi:hypothetical protein